MTESLRILRQHRTTNRLDRFGERLERLGAVIIESLDFVIELRALLRHPRGDIELRVERRARELREARRRFPAIGKSREERDVERMRQPENISDKSIMLIEGHGDLLDHRGCKQFARPLERFGMTEIDEDDVTPRQ